MNVVCAMVMSLDGKTTKGNSSNIYTWTSKEDQYYFSKLIKSYRAIVMGKNTYLAARKIMKLSPGKLRIVLTKNPKKLSKQAVPNQLEFINSSPLELLRQLSKRGYKEVLLVGGATTNRAFFKANLVNEIWVTVEPLLFGKGNGLVENELNVKLKLLSITKLNKRGTLLLKYKV